MNSKKIGVGYLRYSNDNQRSESIDAQKRKIMEYCKKRGDIVISKWYIDRAKSATTTIGRKEFNQMLIDSAEHKFEFVVVHKLDRFSRSRFDAADSKRKLKFNGVSVLSVLENLDESPESIIQEALYDGMAEYYSANLAREVRKGHNENALKMKHNGGKPPLGYDVNPKTQLLEINA